MTGARLIGPVWRLAGKITMRTPEIQFNAVQRPPGAARATVREPLVRTCMESSAASEVTKRVSVSRVCDREESALEEVDLRA